MFTATRPARAARAPDLVIGGLINSTLEVRRNHGGGDREVASLLAPTGTTDTTRTTRTPEGPGADSPEALVASRPDR
jgi:hypothetical protein